MQTKTQTHTPTPFKQGYNDNQVIWADYKRVATLECSNKDWKANAKFIVKACNSHYELLEACKEALIMYKDIQPKGGWQHVEDALENAIQKAESEV